MNTFLNLTNTDYDIFGIDENKTYFLMIFSCVFYQKRCSSFVRNWPCGSVVVMERKANVENLLFDFVILLGLIQELRNSKLLTIDIFGIL